MREEDFNQLDVRLRGKGTHKQMVLTFNPVSVLHWLKRRFFDRQDPRALVVKSTYKDNCFLDEDYKVTLESYKATDPYYYSVYCLGEWGVLGQTIFDAQKVTERLSQLAGPVKRGEFVFSTWYNSQSNEVLIDNSTIKWVDSPTGPIQIYQEPAPGEAYVIGADTAGEGSDFNVARWYATAAAGRCAPSGARWTRTFSPSSCTAWASPTTQPLSPSRPTSPATPSGSWSGCATPGSTCARRRTVSPTARGRATALKPAASPGPWSSPGWWRLPGSTQSGSTTKTR